MTEPLYMLDSNICIYVLHGGADLLRTRIETHAPGALATSAIAYAEVMRGLPQDAVAQAGAAAFFRTVTVLPFDEGAARCYRDIPFRRGTFDRLIAAHALSRGLVIITNDEADFADIPALKVENWTRA